MQRALTFTSPTRLARALDWSKTTSTNNSILCLLLERPTPSAALCFHPRTRRPPEPVSWNDDNALPSTTHGILVGWPLQANGHCGAACGRVLHQLEQHQHQQCDHLALYAPDHSTRPAFVDAWGRDPTYVHTTPKQCHMASHEQYHQHACSDLRDATDVWQAFCAEYWPQYATAQKEEEEPLRPMASLVLQQAPQARRAAL